MNFEQAIKELREHICAIRVSQGNTTANELLDVLVVIKAHEARLQNLLDRAASYIPAVGSLGRNGKFVPNMADKATVLSNEIAHRNSL